MLIAAVFRLWVVKRLNGYLLMTINEISTWEKEEGLLFVFWNRRNLLVLGLMYLIQLLRIIRYPFQQQTLELEPNQSLRIGKRQMDQTKMHCLRFETYRRSNCRGIRKRMGRKKTNSAQKLEKFLIDLSIGVLSFFLLKFLSVQYVPKSILGLPSV